MVTVLGISCSLRNARFGAGSENLVKEIESLKSESELKVYLQKQTKIRADDFFAAGRAEKESFDAIYRNLLRHKGDRGLSNSEAALAAGLWGATQEGARIEHLGLASHFPMSGTSQDLDKLREAVLGADALLVSGPVYFGDRGSLAQEFFEFLREDDACRRHVRNRVYAGIAVGAKRNGGQETTLIYQLIDTTNLNLLAVGNDSETTSQYGGTAHAGDVGSLANDDYGVTTSIGTGRRVAAVSALLERGKKYSLKDKTRVAIWLLQDTEDHYGLRTFERFRDEVQARVPDVEMTVMDFTWEQIYRCIACDICPNDMGPPDEYRCIIKSPDDLFQRRHQQLIDTDAIILAAYSPIDRRRIKSVYQKFIERTRYMRRDEYVIGDRIVAPLVISQIGSNQNLHVRMLTSFIRHQMILHHPLIGFEHDERILNWESLLEQGESFARNAIRVTAGRLTGRQEGSRPHQYNPVGYVISKEKRAHDIATGKAEQVERLHHDRLRSAKAHRLA